MEVVVVGAGISGLAAAYELQQRGARVTVLEAAGVGAGQSAGLARIFRVAHADPRLCALALEARERWRAWEAAFGLHLLGDEGLVVIGGEAHEAAMRTAGAPVEPADVRARIPLLAPGHPWADAIFDPLAGSLRIRRALEALAARVPVRREAVDALEEIEADAVLVCAGLGTQPLVAPLGLDFALAVEPHVRVTYDRAPSAACIIAPELYGTPIGSTGRYAIGMHELGATPEMFPELRPVSELECVSLSAPWLDARGDGFVALRAGRVLAFNAGNGMKFGPLIGDRLARSVLDGDVHPDLYFSVCR